MAKKPLHDAEFDEFAQDYREQQNAHLWAAGDSSEYFAEYKVRKLVEWLPQLQNEKINILDFGCGDGLMTEYLRRYFLYATIAGVDISSNSIELAKNEFKNLDFRLIEEQQIPFAPQSFDLIVSAGVFHHIPPAEHSFWIAQLNALLKPQGVLVLFELNPLNPGTQLIFNNHPMEKNAKMLWPWQCKNLLQSFSNRRLLFYCFFPKWFKFLRFLEPWLTKIPIGGLYACIGQKTPT